MSDPGFTTFWGIRHSPFLGRVDVPANLLLDGQRAAASRILIAAQEGAPMVVTGAPEGAGSTVLSRWLYDSLPESSHHAMLLASGAPGVDPAALSARIADFGVSRLGIPRPATLGDSLREQLIALAPVFDAIRNSGKRLAIIFDNAANLTGEPWAAYFLAVVRQGELVEGIAQFFLFGFKDGLDSVCAQWPRALDARTMKIPVSAPDAADQKRWVENRLVMAGCDPAAARKVFAGPALQRAILISGNNLTRLGRIAEGAMIESFMDESRQVAVRHVDIAAASSVLAPMTSDRVLKKSQGINGSRTNGPVDRGDGTIPGLLDLLKPDGSGEGP